MPLHLLSLIRDKFKSFNIAFLLFVIELVFYLVERNISTSFLKPFIGTFSGPTILLTSGKLSLLNIFLCSLRIFLTIDTCISNVLFKA